MNIDDARTLLLKAEDAARGRLRRLERLRRWAEERRYAPLLQYNLAAYMRAKYEDNEELAARLLQSVVRTESRLQHVLALFGVPDEFEIEDNWQCTAMCVFTVILKHIPAEDRCKLALAEAMHNAGLAHIFACIVAEHFEQAGLNRVLEQASQPDAQSASAAK